MSLECSKDDADYAAIQVAGEILGGGVMSSRITNPRIDRYYSRAIEYGAVGGKLLGAGGGGFLLLYCEPENQESLRNALFDLYEMPFKFDWAGSKIIYVGSNLTDKGFFC